MIEQTQGSMESVCLVIHSLIVYLALDVQGWIMLSTG